MKGLSKLVISRVIIRAIPFRAHNSTYNLLNKSPAPSSFSDLETVMSFSFLGKFMGSANSGATEGISQCLKPSLFRVEGLGFRV